MRFSTVLFSILFIHSTAFAECRLTGKVDSNRSPCGIPHGQCWQLVELPDFPDLEDDARCMEEGSRHVGTMIRGHYIGSVSFMSTHGNHKVSGSIYEGRGEGKCVVHPVRPVRRAKAITQEPTLVDCVNHAQVALIKESTRVRFKYEQAPFVYSGTFKRKVSK